MRLSFSLCCKAMIQHCKTRGVLHKNADPECRDCSSARSCRSAAAANTCHFRECGEASGSADATRTSRSSRVAENSIIREQTRAKKAAFFKKRGELHNLKADPCRGCIFQSRGELHNPRPDSCKGCVSTCKGGVTDRSGTGVTRSTS